jgi:hypothetical protein
MFPANHTPRPAAAGNMVRLNMAWVKHGVVNIQPSPYRRNGGPRWNGGCAGAGMRIVQHVLTSTRLQRRGRGITRRTEQRGACCISRAMPVPRRRRRRRQLHDSISITESRNRRISEHHHKCRAASASSASPRAARPISRYQPVASPGIGPLAMPRSARSRSAREQERTGRADSDSVRGRAAARRMATSMPGAACRFCCAAAKKPPAAATDNALDCPVGGASAASDRAAMPAKLQRGQ